MSTELLLLWVRAASALPGYHHISPVLRSIVDMLSRLQQPFVPYAVLRHIILQRNASGIQVYRSMLQSHPLDGLVRHLYKGSACKCTTCLQSSRRSSTAPISIMSCLTDNCRVSACGVNPTRATHCISSDLTLHAFHLSAIG